MHTIGTIVKRSWAIVLLAVFSFGLIGPAVFANLEAKLPSCCARGGKHHCSSMGSTTGHESSGPAARETRQRCPYYPSGAATPIYSWAALKGSSLALFAAPASHPAMQAQTEARYRASFSRSRQKRGPPVLPC
jgi:hypothetical protein